MEQKINEQLINIMQKDGQLTVSSREVAQNFQKENKTVNRDIRNLIAQNCTVKNLFIESEYVSSRGRKEIEYLLTRDGFSLLVMGFTGKKALEWKLKYIEAFNTMEEEFKNNRFKLPKNYKEALICLVKAEEEKEELQEKIIELKPKAEYTEKVLKNDGVVSISKIAKDYGISPQRMNKKLHELGIQYKQGKQWLLYKKYQDCGYTHSNTEYCDKKNESSMHTYWTQSGREFIYIMLKLNGILPTIEKNKKNLIHI